MNLSNFGRLRVLSQICPWGTEVDLLGPFCSRTLVPEHPWMILQKKNYSIRSTIDMILDILKY